ncbi:MAG: DUF6198 family protein [Clostridiales bacterium]|nr:DUF6198 family protein [Clostridiales bacterium]
MNQKRNNQNMQIWRGELALLTVILINSFGVDIVLCSGWGISPISSVPFAFSEVFPILTLGTWTYLFQGSLVLSLMILRKRFVPQYLFSFVVGFAFGKMIDFYEPIVNMLPFILSLRVLYFLVGCFLLTFGITLSNRCGLPIIPTDLFPRELSVITGIDYSRIKVTFDGISVLVTAILTIGFLGHLEGLGAGTIVMALSFGQIVGVMGAALDKKVRFVSFLSANTES